MNKKKKAKKITLDLKPWEQIPKVKLSQIKKNPQITKRFKDAPYDFKASQPVKVLERIFEKNKYMTENNQTQTLHDNLMNIVSHPDLLRLGFRQLSKNKGAMTPGTQNNTADDSSEAQIQALSQSLKDGSFKWAPVLRIMIPKPGRKEKRPLGLPDFNNKMVQYACKEVLQAIYEPDFQKYEVNSGFRPKRDCLHAIRNIKRKAQFADYVIEGDIVGAYNNVDHQILIKILKKKIKDRKFLKLLLDGFRSGIIQDYTYFDSFLGVPQGGITSPILFNIYMHELDKFVENTLKTEIAQKNTTNPTVEVTSDYSAIKSKIFRAKTKLKALQETPQQEKKIRINFEDKFLIISKHPEMFENIPFVKMKEFNKIQSIIDSHKTREGKATGNEFAKWKAQLSRNLTPEQIQFIESQYTDNLEKKVDILTSEKRSTPYLDIDRKETRIYYHRYADDWTLWLRGNEKVALELKERIAKFLKEELKLELSQEKTQITFLEKNKAKFLGFEIYFPTNELLRKRADNQSTQRVRPIQITPDVTRLDSRFILRKYMDPKKKSPREVGWLTVLTDHEIITKYNQFMIGLGNYYIPEITIKSRLNRWHYLLYFGCLKTLATKHKISVKSVIKKFGYLDLSVPYKSKAATDIRICCKVPSDKLEKNKWVTLINYKEFMFSLFRYKSSYDEKVLRNEQIYTPTIDFFVMHKTNFRTKFKSSTCCSICGSTEKLQNHHIKPIKHSGGKFTGYGKFDRLVASLGRKQLTVCKPCHCAIHAGQYNGIALSDIYDVRLVAPESYINLSKIKSNPPPEQPSKTRTFGFYEGIINEELRTYFNSAYSNYLHNKYGETKSDSISTSGTGSATN